MRHVFISAAVMANSKDQDYTERQMTRKLIAVILVNAKRKLIALNMKAYCNDMVNTAPMYKCNKKAYCTDIGEFLFV